MSPPPIRVFVSYASRYHEWVSALHDHLEQCLAAAGQPAEVFQDTRDLRSGRTTVSQLEAGLDAADHLVVIATPEAMASRWVSDETESFIHGRSDWSRGHCHVANLVDTPLPPFLAQLHYADFRQHDEKKYRAALAKLVAGILEEDAAVVEVGAISPPEAPRTALEPALRRQLIGWLEPMLASRMLRRVITTALGLEPAMVEGHPSRECGASALLVEYTGDDDAVEAALRVIKILSEELKEEPKRLEALAPIRAAIEDSRGTAHPEGSLLATWLEKVDRDHRTLVPYFQRGEEMELLERIYVQLALRPEALESSRREGALGQERVQALGELLELDPAEHPWITRRWVVRGDPGAGKTTLLRHLAGTLAREGKPRWVPVFESLPRLMREREWLFDRIARTLARSGTKSRGLPAVLEREAQEGRLLVLLDGLDEVPKDDREDAEGLVRDLAARWPETPIVVTSRPIGYRRPAVEFIELDLLPFDHERRRRFLAQWFGRRRGAAKKQPGEEALAVLEEDPALEELAGNPLYLTLMALLLEEGLSPKRNRTRLYDQVFELLLEGRYRPGGQPMEAQAATRAVLRHLGEAMTRENLDAEPVTALEARLYRPEADPLREPLERVPRWRRSVRPFLDELAERTGILGPHDGPDADWRFWHRTFREALAAERLEETFHEEGPEGILEHARQIAGDESRWAEPYALLAGRIETPDELVKALVAENKALGLRAVATAQGLSDATVTEVLELSEKWEERAKVYERIPDLVGAADRALALIERLRRRTRHGGDLFFLDAAAAEVSRRWEEAQPRVKKVRRRLFDHIPAPPEDLFAWIETPIDGRVPMWREIPAGTFQMGSAEGDETAFDPEKPQHEVTIEQTFRMAATAVTNAQYAVFDPEHPARRWSGIETEELDHHPVVNVSWYEAVSFCRWLSRTLPEADGIRLPREEEWEYACRAGTETRYWSGDEETELAEVGWYDGNSSGRTHRVGEKPANPWGLYDVHGNVFEWTLNRWTDDYASGTGEAEIDSSGAMRVIRGGSYWGDAQGVRAADRDWSVPQLASDVVGFRVVLAPPPALDLRS